MWEKMMANKGDIESCYLNVSIEYSGGEDGGYSPAQIEIVVVGLSNCGKGMAVFIDTQSVQKAVSDSCHFVPCEIDFNGEAKVGDFFCKTIAPNTDTTADGDDLTASFRGRPLNGSEITLPNGYTGLVLKERHKRSTEDEDRTLTATHRFDSFTYWNLDKQTTPDDLIQKALQWVDISSALHQPVSLEASQESSQSSVKGQ